MGKFTLNTMKKKRIITKNWTMGELVAAYPYPAVMDAINKLGLHCIGCQISQWETIEQGVLAHGLSTGQLEKLLDELNVLVKGLPAKSGQIGKTVESCTTLKPLKRKVQGVKTRLKSKTI